MGTVELVVQAEEKYVLHDMASRVDTKVWKMLVWVMNAIPQDIWPTLAVPMDDYFRNVVGLRHGLMLPLRFLTLALEMELRLLSIDLVNSLYITDRIKPST